MKAERRRSPAHALALHPFGGPVAGPLTGPLTGPFERLLIGWSRRRLVPGLLALLFMLGQTLAIAHATQHELAPDGNAACASCAVAHAPGVGGTVLPPAPFIPKTRESAAAPRRLSVLLRPTQRPRSRAPPFSSLA